MTKIDNYVVVPRHNRPGTMSRNFLEFQTMLNGQYFDPYEVCSVHIFKNNEADSPDKYLVRDGSSPYYGHVKGSAAIASADMIFCNSGGINWEEPKRQNPRHAHFRPSRYNGQARQWGGRILRTGRGKFGVILQPSSAWFAASATYNREFPDLNQKVNSASSTGKYFDIWTVVTHAGASATTYINNFELKRDNLVTTTEGINFTTSHKLLQKYLEMGSRIKLELTTEHVIHNRNIPPDVKNLFMDSVITNARFKVWKVTDKGRIPVRGWRGSGGHVEISSADTITYLFDTNRLRRRWVLRRTGEPPEGIYEIQAKYRILNERRFTEKFKIVVR